MFNNSVLFLRISIVSFLLSVVVFPLKGQSVLLFEKKEIDLGYIPEDTGNVVVEFSLVNASFAAAIIQEIDTPGGCRIVSYPKDSIAAGQKGKIVVKLNPKNRPGPLVRRIVLRSLPDSTLHQLYIKGYVEPSEKVWADKNSNETKQGNLVLSSDYIRIGNVYENAKVEKHVKLKNTGKSTLKFTKAKFKIPSYLTISNLPDKLIAGEELTLAVNIDFSKSGNLGLYTDMIELFVEGIKPGEVIIYLIGKIIPVTPSSPNKAVVEMLSREVNLNEINADKPVEGTFVLKNTGLSPLLIRKVETSCTCIEMKHSTAIDPGNSATIYFNLDPRTLSGEEEKKITLYTNAPDQPILHLLVKAKVIP